MIKKLTVIVLVLLLCNPLVYSAAMDWKVIAQFTGLFRSPAPEKLPDGAHVVFDNFYIKDGNIQVVKGRDRLDSTAHADPAVNGIYYYEIPENTSAGASTGNLALHMDGTDTSTTFTDSSSVAHTVTANGDAQIDTAQSKFGGASGLFDGAGDYLSIPDSTDFDIGTGDFTVDCWVRPNSTVFGFAGATIFDLNDGFSNPGLNLWISGSTEIRLSTNASVTHVRSATFSADTWYHIAVIRVSGVIRIFVDGVQAGANISDSVNIQTSLGIRVGQSISNSTYKWAGWIEELRVVKGTAYFTTNFVPSTSAYGGDGTTIAAKQKLIVAESAAIVSYDINGTNRTVLATNITNEPHDFVQIGNTLYIQSQTDGLYSWVGTGSAVAVGSVSAPSALSITASTTIGGLTSGEDALVACKNSISRCELIACTATTGGTTGDCFHTSAFAKSCATSATYQYKVTKFNPLVGLEAEPSSAGNVTLIGGNTVGIDCTLDNRTIVTTGQQTSTTMTLASAPSAPFAGYRVYRTVAQGSDYFLLGYQTTGAYTDGKPDTVLGNALDTTIDTITPPSYKYIEEYKGAIFTAENNSIRFTRVPTQAAVNADTYWLNTDEIVVSDTKPISGLKSTSNSLLLFTEKSVWEITGFGADTFKLNVVLKGLGTVSDSTIQEDENADILFFAGTLGVYKLRTKTQDIVQGEGGQVIQPSKVDLIKVSSPALDKVFDGTDSQIVLTPSNYATSHAYYDLDNHLYFLYIGQDCFIYDNLNNSWSHIPASKFTGSVYRKSASAAGQGVLTDSVGFFYNNWIGYENGIESGTVTGNPTSSGNTTLTDSGAAFNTTNDGLKGLWVFLDNDNGEWRQITSNTATQITVGTTWTANPVTADIYYIAYIRPELRTKLYNFGNLAFESRVSDILLTVNPSATAQNIELYSIENKTTFAVNAKTLDLSDTTPYGIHKVSIPMRGTAIQYGIRGYVYNTSATVRSPIDIITYSFKGTSEGEL